MQHIKSFSGNERSFGPAESLEVRIVWDLVFGLLEQLESGPYRIGKGISWEDAGHSGQCIEHATSSCTIRWYTAVSTAKDELHLHVNEPLYHLPFINI